MTGWIPCSHFVIGVAIIVVGLAVSIGLHEIGHLVPAKLFGVKVTQYMIGFGPTIWSKRKGETEYGIKAIPLGSYIAMIGMFPPDKGSAAEEDGTGFFRTLVQDARDSSAESITTGDEHRAFYRLPVWKRIVVMFGGPFMNLLLAIVLFAVLLMGFGISQPSTTIGSVSECALPATSRRQTCEAVIRQRPAPRRASSRATRSWWSPASPSSRGPSRPRSSAITRARRSTWSCCATATKVSLEVRRCSASGTSPTSRA